MIVTYTIVTENEANLREGKIASTTPIAQGLMGHRWATVCRCRLLWAFWSLRL